VSTDRPEPSPWALPSRRANRLLRDAVRAHEAGAPIEFFCECGSFDCTDTVPLTCPEYDARRELRGAITARGHTTSGASPADPDSPRPGEAPPWILYVPASDGAVLGFRHPDGAGEIVWRRERDDPAA